MQHQFDVLRFLSVIGVALHLAACTSANPLGFAAPGSRFKTAETARGVVNGVWQYDPARNSARLQGAFARASEAQAQELANRYLVRIGINRSYFISQFLEVVILPTEWTYSLDEVIDDGRTVNVGDVVDVRGLVGTYLAEAVVIVRKCNAPAVPDENRDWSIGCKRVEGFDSSGYGGEKYYLSGF